jgi:lipid-binding SYLF domain-containing protein
MRTPKRLRFAALCLALGLAPMTPARAQKPPDVVVSQAIQAMNEVTRNPKTGMPRLVMRNARGIVIVPNMFKAGFVIGARFGRGLLMVHQPDGSWSNPVFIHLVGGSFGFQAGAQKTDLILVFQTQRGLDRFIKGRDKLTLGVDAGVAAGPVGKRFEAATDVALRSEILSYSNTRGVFAGVSAEGGTLQIDRRANTNYYGRPVSVGEILAVNSTLPITAEAGMLQTLLFEKTGSPTPVVPGAVIQGETIIIEGDAPVVENPAPRTSERPTRTRVVRPEPTNDFDDLDPLPEARPAPRSSATANDEDLPTAIPDPRPARPENQPLPAKPKAKVEPLDDIPPLDPPSA